MAAVDPEDACYIEEASLPGDSDDEFCYDEVSLYDDTSSVGCEEDLEKMKRKLAEASKEDATVDNDRTSTRAESRKECNYEVVEDFVRNFLVGKGMTATLDSFQIEWYDLKQKGLINEDSPMKVPNVYIKNQELEGLLKQKIEEVEYYQGIAKHAKDVNVRLRKERDHHKMHHKRISQEKSKLIADIKKLKEHYSSYESILKDWKQKYETAMKEKMLAKLERDRAIGQVQGLEDSLYHAHSNSFEDNDGSQDPSKQGTVLPPLRRPAGTSHPKDSTLPLLSKQDAVLKNSEKLCPHLTRSGGYKLTHTFEAHPMAVSGLALHCNQMILATVSDDRTWSCWELPSGNPILTGSGHTSWLSSCDFHPSGTHIATASGDSTVKIWSFNQGECVATFTDHTHVVWGCSFHVGGDFLVSCSMDTTSKIWDMNSERCRQTLRGHTDSVNDVVFLPQSNIVCTCSADKTVSLWDLRTALCVETFCGHVHSINSVAFNMKGDTIASCDSYGTVKTWDVRQVTQQCSIDVGPHPANCVAFDPSGAVLGVASNDGTVNMCDFDKNSVVPLTGHEDAAQALLFDKNNEFLLSGGSDGTVRLWS